MQTPLTAVKIIGIALIVGGVFFVSPAADWKNLEAPQGTPRSGGAQAFGAAMVGALYAYIGWDYLGKVAGEVRGPGRTIPRPDGRRAGRADNLRPD